MRWITTHKRRRGLGRVQLNNMNRCCVPACADGSQALWSTCPQGHFHHRPLPPCRSCTCTWPRAHTCPATLYTRCTVRFSQHGWPDRIGERGASTCAGLSNRTTCRRYPRTCLPTTRSQTSRRSWGRFLTRALLAHPRRSSCLTLRTFATASAMTTAPRRRMRTVSCVGTVFKEVACVGCVRRHRTSDVCPGAGR